ncbi:MAG TPA: class I SAM-dependent methyltransferase [Allosphingosinicella sp.]|jgi:SAM-dependent methyltransferase
MTPGATDLWTDYWASGGSRGAGCLPNAAGPVEQAQRRIWQEFARSLPKGARVIDLATGNGIVPGWMTAARRDLKAVGVDSAAALPPAPAGVTLKAGVALERLPFPHSSFDAATSQFGIEYGDSALAAAELARVLRPGAPVRMLVHHARSPLVAHNRARREALRWSAGPQGWLEKAKAFAGAGAGLPVPSGFRDAPMAARRRFAGQPVAAEFMVGILQRLDLLPTRGGAEVLGLLGAMEREAKSEIGRIDLLEGAALDETGVASLVEDLAGAGLAMDPPALLPAPGSDGALAWLVSGTR